MAMEVDEAIALCGDRSRWHFMMFIVLGIMFEFPSCWQVLSIIFIGAVPTDYHCKVPNDAINDTIPFTKDPRTGEPKRDQCRQFVNETVGGVLAYSSNETTSCTDGYTYHTDFESTIVMEWSLVCDREWQKDLSQTLFTLGVMVGAVVCTILADAWGRKPVFLVVNWILLVVGTATAFVHNVYLFLFMRFVLGILQQGITLSGYVLICELFAANQRTFAGMLIQIFWGIAMLVKTGIAYAVRDWRDFQLAITLPMVVTIAGWWVIPESVNWQAANGKEKQAEETLRKIAKFNGIDDYPEHPLTEKPMKLNIDKRLLNLGKEDPDDASEEPETQEEKPRDRKKSFKDQLLRKKSVDEPKVKKETLMTVLKHRKLAINLLVMFSLWFVNSLVYFGLSLTTGDLAGDRYINFAIGAFVELLAAIAVFFILDKFGRRKPLCVLHIVAGVALIISVFIPPKVGGVNLTAAVVTFNMIGRFCIAGTFNSIFLYAGELFPVNVRSTCTGVCSVAARVGGMLAPFSSLLVKKVYWLPGCIFAAFSIIVGILVLLLPETQGRALPQTVEEMLSWDRKRGRAKSFDVHASMRESRRERRRSSRGRSIGGQPEVA